MTNTTTGTLFIVSAPSGAGKTSLLAAMLDADDSVKLSVSHTTREKREGEEHSVHYHFVSTDEFADIREANGFLEWAQVFDNSYGTSEQAVRNQLASGQDVVLEIDWQGARQVRLNFPGAVTIFVIPPTVEALRQRLTSRGQDDKAIVDRRMRDAQTELSHFAEYDYLIVNDDFDDALDDLRAVFRCQQLKMSRQQKNLAAELKGLLEN